MTDDGNRTGIRLQKILSGAGIASRRAAEVLIEQGRVSVNGRVVRERGTKADPARDDIRVDGRRVKARASPRYILVNKPTGYVTTRSDPRGRPTVLDLIPGDTGYVYPVGRLDFESEGLVLLTNDGDLAARLMHPRHEVERTYEAIVRGVPQPGAVARFARGIVLDGRRTAPARATILKTFERRGRQDALLEIVLREGRNRQVRRMCEAIGHPVERLTRVRIGPLADPRLKPGMWRDLTPGEVARLMAAPSTPGESLNDRRHPPRSGRVATRPGSPASRPRRHAKSTA